MKINDSDISWNSTLEEEKRKMKVRCPYCQHKIHFYAFEDTKKQLCDYCGKYVFKNKKEEYKYRVKEIIERNKRQ